MREVLDRSTEGDQRAMLARDVYVHRLQAEIASMVAAMDGIDALIFTGGVGENSAEIRTLAIAGLAFLGVSLDAERNLEAADRVISPDGSDVTVLVILSREDLQIAREVRRLVG
jgi:acetate kinase